MAQRHLPSYLLGTGYNARMHLKVIDDEVCCGQIKGPGSGGLRGKALGQGQVLGPQAHVLDRPQAQTRTLTVLCRSLSTSLISAAFRGFGNSANNRFSKMFHTRLLQCT